MLILKKCQHISCFKEEANLLGCVYMQVFLDDAKIKDTRIFFFMPPKEFRVAY